MEQIIVLLWVLLCILWIGIGFISALVIEGNDNETEGQEKISVFIRICWVLFWPITLFIYLIVGMSRE